jgi:hypothetical protein
MTIRDSLAQVVAPAEDPDHPNNGAKYQTGKLCVEGCGRPAGTAWSPFWCQPCNAQRFRMVDQGFEACLNKLKGADHDE